MNRKILIVSYAYPPSSSPGAQRVSRLVRRLPSLGWEPYVLTVGAAVMQRSSGGGDPLSDLPDRVRRIDDPLAMAAQLSAVPPRQDGTRGRFSLRSLATILLFPDRTILWALRLLRERRWCKNLAPDIVISTSPSLSSHLAGWWLARQCNAKWVAEFRDPVSWLPKKNSASSFRRHLLSWIEGRIVRTAHSTVVVSETFADYFRGRYVGTRIVSIPNGAEFDEKTLGKTIASRQKHISSRPKNAPLVLVHSGELYGGERDPKPLIAAAILAQSRVKRPIKLRFIGGDSHLAGVAATALGAKEIVDVGGSKTHVESLRETVEADGLIALLHDDPIGRISIMSKFFDYATTGNPVLVVGERAATLSKMVEENKMGRAFEYSDVDGIAAWIEQLAEKPESFSYDCLSVCRKWSADAMASSMSKLLSSIVT